MTTLLAGYPLWWALGIADYAWILLAIPMALRMLAWRKHGSRKIKLPDGIAPWLLFLAWSGAGVFLLTLTAPGTVASPVGNRLISWAVRTMSYIAITILLLYVGNLTEKELSRRRLAWLLGLLAIYTTALGVAAMVVPTLQFTSPVETLLPTHLRANAFIQASMHPALAQVQNVFGTAQGQGRPKAPFDYTNTWGECLTITMPWLLVAALDGGTRRWRVAGWIALALGLVVLVYSLNRGAWLGVGVCVLYLALRLAARGRIVVIGGLTAALAAVVILIVASPLHNVISQRLQNGDSDSIRLTLSALAIRDATASPILGYGDTRQQRGSTQSIAVGPTPQCPICGQQAVGSTGQLWLLLITSGIVGALLYMAFFAYGIWRYRRDQSAYGIVGVLVLLLSFLYMLTYDAVPAPLGLTMLAYGLLWRSQQHAQMLGTAQPAAGGRSAMLPEPLRPAGPGSAVGPSRLPAR